MIDVFIALLLAHVVADFIAQPDAMIRRKTEPAIFVLHIMVVFGLSWGALGGAWQLASMIAAAHLMIDAIKTWALPDTWRDSLPAFLGDQAAHILTLAAAAILMPETMQTGYWADYVADLRSPVILCLWRNCVDLDRRLCSWSSHETLYRPIRSGRSWANSRRLRQRRPYDWQTGARIDLSLPLRRRSHRNGFPDRREIRAAL
jgi:hypothetical protein